MRPALSALVAGLVLMSVSPGAASAGTLDEDVLPELNFARSQPREYARRRLQEPAAYERGRYLSFAEQDSSAFEEAFDFLMRQPSLPPLQWDERLAAAARSHASSQGSRGSVGHTGPRGESPASRMQSHGVWAGSSAENISYGYATPREVVLQLIIDSGVPTRGHRQNIFGRSFQAAGVGCGPHRAYGSMCTIDFAAIVER